MPDRLHATRSSARPARAVGHAVRAPRVLALRKLQRTIGNRATSALMTASAPARCLQRLTEDELRQRGTDIEARIAEAPASSGFLWHLTEKTSNTNLYLLGTVHGQVLASLAKKKALVDFLVDTTFDQVYAELDQPNVALDAKAIRADIDTLATPPTTAMERYEHRMATRRLEAAGGLDEIYTNLAADGQPIRGLETNATRAQIRAQYAAGAGPNVREQEMGTTENTAKLLGIQPEDILTPTQSDTETEQQLSYGASQAGLPPMSAADIESGRRSRRARDKIAGYVTGGDERKLMEVYAGHLKQGLDPQDAEARNQRWAAGVVPGAYRPGQTVLWVVGASHVGGLTVELSNLGWTAKAKTL